MDTRRQKMKRQKRQRQKRQKPTETEPEAVRVNYSILAGEMPPFLNKQGRRGGGGGCSVMRVIGKRENEELNGQSHKTRQDDTRQDSKTVTGR
jgi:hypothetical protein